MAVDNKKKRFQGKSSFLGGVNSNLQPRLLGDDQLSWAVNATSRGGSLGPRPGFRQAALNWPTASHETNFQLSTAKFQGATTAQHPDGTGVIYASIGGRIFVIEPGRQFTAADITPSNDPNSPNPEVVTFAQAEQWVVVQDESSSPIILESSNSRRATAQEVKTGTLSKYVNGRLWTARGFDYLSGS